MSEWPKRVTAYVHGRPELALLGEEIGLTEAALCLFKYALAEIRVELDVQENGDATIVSVNGVPHIKKA